MSNSWISHIASIASQISVLKMDNQPDSLDRHFFALMRSRDYEGAVRFFKERLREALQAEDEEATVDAAHLLISSLTAAGLDQEAFALLWQVVNSLPGEAYLRSSFAGFLLSSLKQPAQALEVLDPVFDELVAERGSRHATLGLRGAILFALGRVEEAERGFREMLEPSLSRMDPSAFDFRLVESLISEGLRKEDCEHYLKIVYQRAQEANDQGVLKRAEGLLRLLQ
jgi:tetratricopeptide (TPR) repeat protein